MARVDHILTSREQEHKLLLGRNAAFKIMDESVQKFITDVLAEGVERTVLPLYRKIEGNDVLNLGSTILGSTIYSIAVNINNDLSAREIIKLLLRGNNPLYKDIVKIFTTYVMKQSASIDGLGDARRLLYESIITGVQTDNVKFGKFDKQYSKLATSIFNEGLELIKHSEQSGLQMSYELYRLAKIALYLHMYPELANGSALSMDTKIAVIQELEKSGASPNIVVIQNYLKRNNLGLTSWVSLVDWSGMKDYPDTVIAALYNYVIAQLQPGGREARVSADEFDRRTGTLSVACDAKQYPELEAAALSLLSGASLMSLCRAVTMFQDRLELTGPCSEAEIEDITDVLTQLIPTLSKRELCALIGIFR